MSIQSGHTFFVLVGIISVIILTSAISTSNSTDEIKIKWSSPTIDAQEESIKTGHSGFAVDQSGQTSTDLFAIQNGIGRNYTILQKRDIDDATSGTNFDKDDRAVAEEGLKQRENAEEQREAAGEDGQQQEKLRLQREATLQEAREQTEEPKKQGEAAPEKTDINADNLGDNINDNGIVNFDNDDSYPISYNSTSSSDNYLSLDDERVHVQVLSPHANQNVGFRGNKVFINDELVCADIEKLSSEQTYQKREDGSMWFTNLQVGTEMTAKEIEEFQREVEEIKMGREMAVEEARKQREAAEEEARKQREAAEEESRRMRREARKQKKAARKQREEATRQKKRAAAEARRQRREARRQREAEEARKQREEEMRQREAEPEEPEETEA